jgi:plastocyanin
MAMAAGAASAGELSGHVEATVKGRPSPGQAGLAVVYFEPDRPVRGATAGGLEMVTQRKELSPRVLVAPKGATVEFPNRDPILHNVFSVSEPQPFDLGLLGQDEVGQVRFERAGVVRVFCNVHHDMVGYVLVLDTPFHTRPDGRGRFRLRDLPPGPGTLTVWHEQAEPWSRRIEVPRAAAAEPVEIELVLTRPRIPPHLDKFGRSYLQRRRDRYHGR